MKIEITPGNCAGACLIGDDNNIVLWENLTREEQMSMLNSIAAIYGLFSKFLKQETDEY